MKNPKKTPRATTQDKIDNAAEQGHRAGLAEAAQRATRETARAQLDAFAASIECSNLPPNVCLGATVAMPGNRIEAMSLPVGLLKDAARAIRLVLGEVA